MTNPTTTPVRADFELPDLVAAWNAAVDDIYALVEPLDDEQWAAPTPCAGWSVGDVVAHCVDIEGWIGGLPRIEHTPDFSTLPHVKSPIGQFIEVGIDARRGRPKDAVLAEYADVIAARRPQVAALTPGQEVQGLTSKAVPAERQLATRVFDLWVHEQDIRAGIGVDGHWDSAPAAVAFRQMTKALPFVWGKSVDAPAGSVLRFEVAGPAFADEFIVAVDADGRADFVDDGTPTVGLNASWPDTMRLMCGRVDIDDKSLRERITLTGDSGLGERLLAELPVTP